MEVIKNTTYSYIRGFNYFPSNVTFLRDVTEMYEEGIWNRELEFAEKFGANTLRIWFDIDSHMRDEKKFIEVFKKGLELIK